ncbi:uncharacterized protein SPSK_01478 [Sporothrix schenckii 1099-18]|uniref:Protein kinase domain-containing protein n=2 Tax=Sporothrix schenckii TaxID=29908 RepID=U7PP36_SPOS1|nr:uncharacterized protein SPSK_01478 [Sporothrix schenckii 1099-18]ERS96484.1 hypothetical protein HMPREF1624_07399 [Sporothrix schenckii ATCC 58251]KJR87224.1 hypothetical protein SPSK_01478 [Sporothrix schenckii 1099-18]
MDNDLIKQLQEQLAQAKQEAERERARVQELEQTAKAERDARLAERDARLAEQRRADEETAKNRNTVYFNYLHNIHLEIRPTLRVETDRNQAALGKAANVAGKVYPRALRPWTDFPRLHQQHFDVLTALFGDDLLFPSYNDSQSVARNLSPGKRRDEQDIRPFIRAYLEVPSMQIVHEFLRRTPDARYTGLGFHFGNNAHGTFGRKKRGPASTNAQDEESSSPSNSQSSSSRLKRKFNSSSALVPDRWGLRVRRPAADAGVDPGGQELPAWSESILPGEYKAAHKVRGSELRNVLGGVPPAASFMDDCAQRRSSSSGSTTTDATDAAGSSGNDTSIAEILCQAYHYMVACGTIYGYVSSGEATVFLMMSPDNADTLLYHFVDHTVPATPITRPDAELMHVPAAQMVTLVLEALLAEMRAPAATTALLDSLPRWPAAPAKEPSSGGDSIDRSNVRSPRGGGGGGGGGGGAAMPPEQPPSPSPSSRGGGGAPASGNSAQPGSGSSRPLRVGRIEPPRRNYCTQACLLGLCRGGPLDPRCPNTPEHVRGPQGEKGRSLWIGADGQQPDSQLCHPITSAELCSLLLEQLTDSLSAGVECLMKYGLFGAIGTLFKVTLCAYGYTFVAKGVQDADEEYLKDEAAIYMHPVAQPLQGVLMPVYLGWVELEEWPYILPSGACVWHLALLSWVGVSLDRYVPPEMALDVHDNDAVRQLMYDTENALFKRGIAHDDIRSPNLAWNKELQRVMVLDFDRAWIPGDEDKKGGKGGNDGKNGIDGKEGKEDKDGKDGKDGKSEKDHGTSEVPGWNPDSPTTKRKAAAESYEGAENTDKRQRL